MNPIESARQAAQGLVQAAVEKAIKLAPDSWVPGAWNDPVGRQQHGLVPGSIGVAHTDCRGLRPAEEGAGVHVRDRDGPVGADGRAARVAVAGDGLGRGPGTGRRGGRERAEADHHEHPAERFPPHAAALVPAPSGFQSAALHAQRNG